MSRFAAALVAVAVALLAACASGADGVLLDRALAEPNEASGVIVISRETGLLGVQCKHRLSLDGKPFAELNVGEQVTIYPSPGQHRLAVDAPNPTCNGEAEMLVVVERGRSQAFRTSGLRNGEVGLVSSTR